MTHTFKPGSNPRFCSICEHHESNPSHVKTAVQLGVQIRIRGERGLWVAFLRYVDTEFRAVRIDSEMGKLIMGFVGNGQPIPNEHQTPIWNASRLCALSELEVTQCGHAADMRMNARGHRFCVSCGQDVKLVAGKLVAA